MLWVPRGKKLLSCTKSAGQTGRTAVGCWAAKKGGANNFQNRLHVHPQGGTQIVASKQIGKTKIGAGSGPCMGARKIMNHRGSKK